MRFGPLPLDKATGAIAAHSLRHPTGVVKKGTRLSPEHIAQLRAAGLTEIIAARLDPSDCHEDEAARRVAEAIRGSDVRVDAAFTGRSNLYAERGGLLVVDRAAVDALNRLDPGLTLATLPEFSPVGAGRMVATVKVIPFAVPEQVVRAAETRGQKSALKIAPWKGLKVGMASTTLPGLKPSVMDKTRRVLEERLAAAGSLLIDEIRVPHEEGQLAGALSGLRKAGAELLIAFGASAVTDEGDVIPAAIRRAGGRVDHFGMPVDPGNLLLIGELQGAPVLGAPGCARSPAENGFDWVLQRLLAGLEVTREDITGMGVGGLLMEIVSRPQPREPLDRSTRQVAAVILAAGQGRRMGGPNKLMARFDGVPLVRRVVEQVLSSSAMRPVIVVTGHRSNEVQEAIAGLDVSLTHNREFADGLATSLKTGLSAVPAEAAAALVILADMPAVTGNILDQLISAFSAQPNPSIVLPTMDGKRGNPVLWPREFFAELMAVTGDTGARHILGAHEESIQRVEIGAPAVLDVDTPEALAAAGGTLWE